MNRWSLKFATITLALFIAAGCSGTGGSPVIQPVQQTPAMDTNLNRQNRTQLWGYYDIIFDPASKSIEVLPNRAMEFTVNIVKFLNNDPMGIQFSFNGTTPGAGYVDVDLDVTIKHPLDDAGFNGYDVRGIFIGQGSGTLAYNTDLKYPVNGTDQVLLNADGYSRWFNPSEFLVPKIWGYVHGNYATPGYTGSATLNAYKYFGEGLAATDNLWDNLTSGLPDTGCFVAGSSNTRNYQVRLPIPDPGIKYGYAVTADWSGKAPQFHPAHAPEAVGCKVIDGSNVYYVDPTDNGGDLILDISLFAWDNQPSQIYIESSVLSSVYELTSADMIPVGGGDHYSTYHVEIPSDNVTGIDDQEYWVVAECEGHDYSNDFGIPNEAGTDPLAAIFRYDLTVMNESPAWIEVLIPDGGEVWVSGTDEEITWSSESVTGTVFIEYSKDNFISDINPVASDEPNDGSFMWENIPDDPSDTVRVRISSTDDPGINDVSDADFTILHPSITVLTPNGGEEWIVGTAEEITWTSQNVTGTVFIEYSKDNFVADINTVATDEPNDGSYMWENIPDDPSVTVRVRISSTDNPGINDVSDADFTIKVIFIFIVAPDGGEEWMPGDNGGIAWGSQNVTGTVFIEYSKDNFIADINTITTDEENDGSYIWEDIPLDPSDTVRVRVSSTDDPGIFDVSSFDFTILQPSITILEPNGGDEFLVGTNRYITWTSQYFLGWIFIEYSKDNFITDINTLATDEANDGSFIWVDIPYDLSDTVRVRVSSTKFPSVNDVSDGDFSIIDKGWAVTWGGDSFDYGSDVATDDSGNVYVTGSFVDTVDFMPGPGVVERTSNGCSDVFLIKLSVSGDLVWVRTWGGTGWDDGYGVTVNGSGNIFVTGLFMYTVDFDPDGGDEHASNGMYDAFLSKFDSAGNFNWARTWGGLDNVCGQGLAVDGDLRVYVTGYFEGTGDFDPDGGDPHISNGLRDVFLSKFDSSGNFEWAHTWGGESYDWGSEVATGMLGWVYVTGSFRETVDFDPDGGDPHTSNGGYDVFLSKFDYMSNFIWAKTWGGPGGDTGTCVATDGSGLIYVSGDFWGTVDFNPNGGTQRTSNGSTDAFLSRFDSSGYLGWVRTWGGPGYDCGYGVAVDNTWLVYVTGSFEDTVDFDPGGGDSHTSNGLMDVFLSKFNKNGDFEWARSWGGSEDDESYGTAIDNHGNVFVTGNFRNWADFAPSDPPCNESVDLHFSNGNADAFLTRYLLDGCW